jgi:hypothetical protein
MSCEESEMALTYKFMFVASAVAFLSFALACGFNPTSPFAGFDEQGSRLSGVFQSNGGGVNTLTAAPSTVYEGLTVYVEQDPSITSVVKSNGAFTLVGLPQGTIAIVFERGGDVIGRLVFRDVVPNQELRIVVILSTSGTVELVEEDRDSVGLGECARSPGFWCENRTGKNPNMTREEFEEYAGGALSRLQAEGVDGFDSIDDVEAAVCNNGDQLLRHLTSVLLNLEAELLDEGTSLIGEELGTVREAVQAAFDILASGGTRSEINEVKDVLDRINNNVNTEGDCEPTESEDDDPDVPDDPDDPIQVPAECQPFVTGKKVTICHKGKNTLNVAIDALPAHLAHGDSCGPCK